MALSDNKLPHVSGTLLKIIATFKSIIWIIISHFFLILPLISYLAMYTLVVLLCQFVAFVYYAINCLISTTT